MTDLLRLACLVAVLAAAGGQLVRLFWPGISAGRTERVAISYLLGVGAVAGVCFLLSLAGVALALPSVVAALAVLGGLSELAIRLARRRRGGGALAAAPRSRSPMSRLDAALLALVVVASAYVVVSAALQPLFMWDTWAIWSLKAKVVLHETVRSTGYFEDPSRVYSHPDYPLLVPLTQAATWLAAGREDQSLPVLPLSLMFLAFQAVACGRLAALAGRRLALAVVAGVSLLPAVMSDIPTGLADIPLAVFLGVTVLFVASWLTTRSAEWLTLAAAFGACMGFTKNEGLPLLAACGCGILLLALLGRERRRMLKGLALYLLIALACLAPWLAFRTTIAGGGADFGGSLAPGDLATRLARLPVILRGFLAEMGSWSRWGLFWPAVLAAVALGGRAILRGENLFLATALLLQLAAYALAYMLTSRDLAWHMSTSLGRLLLQAAPVAAALMALSLRDVLRGGESRGA